MSTTELEQAIAALRADLIHADGPQISTMRNYRFAIVPYSPEHEFELRGHVQRLAGDLRANGWVVLTLSLQKLLLERIRRMGEPVVQKLIEQERLLTSKGSRDRSLQHLSNKLHLEVEGPDGIAADVSREICAFADAHPDKAERTLVLIGRAGALYPFFRTSALLKHLDGRTRNIPVVLLYPGRRRGETSLSFMDMLDADSDYRPRIYP